MKLEFVMFQFQNFKKVFVVTLCAYCVGGFFATTAHASYTVSPMVIDVKSEARDIITKDITLTNTGSEPHTIYPSVNEISLQEGGTIEEFKQAVESDRTKSVTSWVEISRQGIDLMGGDTKTIPLTLRIHPNPVPGTYHAFIGFGFGSNRDEAEAQVRSGRAPGTVLTITIADETTSFLKLSKFIVSRFVTKADNQAAVFTFTNPGEENLVPSGEIIFFDSMGKEVGAVPVNTENVTIPSGGTHTFASAVPIAGMFGKYKAFLTVEYGNTERASLQDTSFFYVFPLKVLLGALGVLIFVVAVVAWYVHKKYFDDNALVDDSERITLHVREGTSEPKEHDVHLTPTS